MTEDRLVHLKTYGNELRQALRPEGDSPLKPESVVDTLGTDVLKQLRAIGVDAQHGDPLEYGCTMAADLEGWPLSGLILNLLVTGVNNSVRFFDTGPERFSTLQEDQNASFIYDTAAVGFLVLKGFVYEACQLQSSEIPTTVHLLADQAELREWLFAALLDGERIFANAVEYNRLKPHLHPLDGQTATGIIAQIREKLDANVALQPES